MQWSRVDSILNRFSGISTLGASQVDSLVSQEAAPTTGHGINHGRLDIYLGFTTVTTGINFKVQTSSGYNIWTDTKSASAASATSQAFTADSNANTLTATAHGLSDGDVILVASTGTLPAGLKENTKYFIRAIDANTLKLYETANKNPNNLIDIGDAGTGTHSLVSISKISITFNSDNAADQAHLPLASSVRVVANTGVGDSVQVVDILYIQHD